MLANDTIMLLGGDGAGFLNLGLATVTDCSFTNNNAVSPGPYAGGYDSGGAIFNTGTLT